MSIETPDYVGISSQHHGKVVAYSSGTQVVAASGNFASSNITMAKPGYWIWITAQMAANAANPFVHVAIQWSESTTNDIIDIERWVIPAGTSAALRTTGRGQVKGDIVKITVTNLDAAQAVTMHFAIFDTTHPATRDDLRSQMTSAWTTTVAGTVAANCSPASNTLIQDAIGVAATSTQRYQLPLYAGQVNVLESDSGATGLTVSIVPTQQLDSEAALSPLMMLTGAATGVARTTALPRQPCQLVITNPNAAAVVCNINAVMTEFAS